MLLRAQRLSVYDIARCLDLSRRPCRTEFVGLILFAGAVAELLSDVASTVGGFPGSVATPAGSAVRVLLALKLWGITCPS